VQRSLKFVKYLPEFGWQPTVLTQAGSGFPKDATMAGGFLEDVEIHRAFSMEPSNLIGLFSRLGIEKPASVSGDGVGEPLGSAPGSSRPGLKRQLYALLSSTKAAVQRTLLIPDGNIGWLPFAFAVGSRLLRRGDFSAIISSSSPYTAHLIGGLLKKRFDIPWVADFRDEWTTNPFMAEHIGNRIRIHQYLEQWVLRNADAVVSVSDEIAKNLASLAPESPATKFHAIYNGYDSEDFEGRRRAKGRRRRFRLSHVGSFYQECQPKDLFDALRILRGRSPDVTDSLEINLVGRTDAIQNWQEIREEFGDVLRVLGRLPHDEAVEEMRDSDALFVTIPAMFGERGLAGKIFEYLAARRPILAVVPKESTAARVIEETESGVVVANNRPERVAETLEAMVAKWREGTLDLKGDQAIANYSRRALTHVLARLLDTL
jgi:glycosyltransferase involved in cell wall biosynthesis